jgi:hypothetical protein
MFLFGLGAGLIVGALLVMLMNASTDQKQKLDALNGINAADKVYSQDEVDIMIDDAKKQVAADKSGQQQPDKPADTGQEQGQTSSTDGAKGNPASLDKTGVGTVKAEPGVKPDSPVNGDTAAVQVDRKVVQIKKGTNLADAASLLKSKGIVDSEKAFIAVMGDASTKIQYGFFFFDGKLTLEQVKAVIIGPPFAE